MPAPCKLCHHPQRESFDAAIVLGQESQQSIATRAEVDRHSVARHRQHITPALAEVQRQRETAGAASALDRIEELYRDARQVLDAAKAGGQGSLTLSAIDRLTKLTELLAKITHELDESARVNVAVFNAETDQTFLAACAAIVAALEPWPDARLAAAAAIRELGAAS